MNIDDLKEIVKNCVYVEKGIACMNDTYYRDIMRTINNLQSKIDKAIERIKYEEMFDNDNHHLVNFKEELLDILKEKSK